MTRDQRTPKHVVIGSSHNVVFTNRSFNRGEAPRAALPTAFCVRPTYPKEVEIREVANYYASQAAFRERSRELAERGVVGPVAKFYDVYRKIAIRIRSYSGRDVVKQDVFLALKARVDKARMKRLGVTQENLKAFARQHIDSREMMVVKMAERGELVDRPNAPRNSRKQGAEAYTQEAARVHADDRVTVIASLPENPGAIFFITLGPATKKVGNHREPCERRIMTVQTPSEWAAWKERRYGQRDKRSGDRRGRRDRNGWRHECDSYLN